MDGAGARTQITPPVENDPTRITAETVGTTPSQEFFIEAEAQIGPGTRIRHYELIRELGRGGMGYVYLARDTKLGRRVAIKFIKTASPELTRRFISEARATARCTHENIVVIHEVDVYENVPYMVLEYLEGRPFKRFMRDRKLPPARAIELTVPVVRALIRAHELGIVHRDLKPDNIILANSGQVKVLDFGVAKILSETNAEQPGIPTEPSAAPISEGTQLSVEGALIGTPPYMSPEQMGADEVDNRTDIWAVGILMTYMIAGRHPLDRIGQLELWNELNDVDKPMPSLRKHAPDTPDGLIHIIDRCLAKRKADRWPTAGALLEALEALSPGRKSAAATGQSPFQGLMAFQEADASRFFGRSKDIALVVSRLRKQPLVAVVGPSGVGKSSFVRAGVVPALHASGEAWDTHIIRPGRSPLAALLGVVATGDGYTSAKTALVAEQMRREPGTFAAVLRGRARKAKRRTLLFVDQFEEIYTLVDDAEERRTFTDCLRAIADDAASPLRVILSMRSDFLDRISEHGDFADELMRSVVLLTTPTREGLEEALEQPLRTVGYDFEDRQIVDDMLDALESSHSALPLLQFTASRLWELRDEDRLLLTRASYEKIGGIAGALAAHADDVLASMEKELRKLARPVFQRLVTPERTRALVEPSELEELAADPALVRRLLRVLVSSRLLVVQSTGDADSGSVELIHDSLITSWPTLRKWLDDSEGDAAYLDQLRTAAKQWHERDRPPGLLWSGEAVEEAMRWHERFVEPLPERERAFLADAFANHRKAGRRKRNLVLSTIVILVIMVAGASVALLRIGQAEKEASLQAKRAHQETVRARENLRQAEEMEESARREAQRAMKAEKKVRDQLDLVQAAEREQEAAVRDREQSAKHVAKASAEVALSRGELRSANKRLRRALGVAEKESDRARKAAAAKAATAKRLERLLNKERARVRRLEKQRGKIIPGLK